MEEGISIIICCFNSSLRLKPTLEHISLQKKVDTIQWEVIVIDNASTDDTTVKAKEIWDSFTTHKPEFKIVYEEKPGLSAARETGIKESKFKYVLFCDDDNWLDINYLYNAFNIMNSSPHIGVLGGIGYPVFEDKEPPHFWDNQYHTLAVGSQWHTEGDITEGRGVLYGAGMVLNKCAYNTLKQDLNFNFQVSDRTGSSLSSSGDHELCLALKRIGYKIFYSESLRFTHYIPKIRTAISYYKNLFLSFGKAEAMLSLYYINNIKSVKNDYRYICLRCAKNIVRTWLVLLFTGYYSTDDKYRYIGELHHLYNNIGILKAMMVIKNSYKKIFYEQALFSLGQQKLSF